MDGNDGTAAGVAALAAGDPYGYKGKYGYYTEPSIGLILCTNRYYDSSVGRWLTRDPIGYDGGMNLYAYCGDDPVGGVDPSGNDWLDNAANFSAGWGDTLTFNATAALRNKLGVDDVVDKNGLIYKAGIATGIAHQFAFSGATAAAARASQAATLVRSVEAAELAEINATGAFRVAGEVGSLEGGKWFWTSVEAAEKYALQMQKFGNQTILKTNIEKGMLTKATLEYNNFLDRCGEARFIAEQVLPYLGKANAAKSLAYAGTSILSGGAGLWNAVGLWNGSKRRRCK